MWGNLKEENQIKYKTFITNFASLSEAFSQKSEGNQDEEDNITVAPIVNSKFQETVFQKSFGAVAEDIANTSYDVSLVVSETEKYLVGIKSFGIGSGDQKIAQFKSNSTSENWEEILSQIKRNADDVKSKEIADKINEQMYLQLAKRIATLRNDRIASSTEQIKGFKVDDTHVEAVYHVLMPSKKGDKPQIFVGEIEYLPIDIENIQILGSTGKRNPTNFKFTDGQHSYKYTSADSQLYMAFHNKEIILDAWDIDYLKDPFYLFENLHLISRDESIEEPVITQTVSWMILNVDGEVETDSGFNGFNGASKLARKNGYREQRISNLQEKYIELVTPETMETIIYLLEEILLPVRRNKADRIEGKKLRTQLIALLEELDHPTLLSDVEAMVYRPKSEMYIPIPNSKQFHNSYPNFFGEQIGTFVDVTKLALPREEREFKLRFMASGEEITAYINQDSGKGIQSTERQDILGEWILRGVFQLEPRQVLTSQRLEEIGINGIRLSKYVYPEELIGIEFIWIDPSNPPKDAIGWVSEIE